MAFALGDHQLMAGRMDELPIDSLKGDGGSERTRMREEYRDWERKNGCSDKEMEFSTIRKLDSKIKIMV